MSIGQIIKTLWTTDSRIFRDLSRRAFRKGHPEGTQPVGDRDIR